MGMGRRRLAAHGRRSTVISGVPRPTVRAALVSVALIAALTAALTACAPAARRSAAPTSVDAGPLAWLLAGSTDLGPAHDGHVSTVVALRDRARPDQLLAWAASNGVQADWQQNADWASVWGPASSMASAFGVSVHDYRGRRGQVFFASGQQIEVPAGARRDVVQVGRILSYSPHRDAAAGLLSDVPANGLNPRQLLNAYGAMPLVSQGFTGKGSTIVFFEWGPFNQRDLDAYSKADGLPTFTPTLLGGAPTDAAGTGETMLDLEVAHASAPDARLVVVNANPSSAHNITGDVGLGIASMFQATDQQFPGAVWSLSIGWACDQIFTAADMRPVEASLEQAEAHGTSVFDASGDTGGLECKGDKDYSTPPSGSDVGVDAVGSLPAMTSVGGTLLATDASGAWAAEEAWDWSSISQGSSGGVSPYLPRPAWQNAQGVATTRGNTHRMIPDVSADADPASGVSILSDGQAGQGGGTSQAAPIWAGLTVLMDEYLLAHGGHLIGAINPLLYQIAAGATRPAFHDVTLGGNAIDYAAPGYDLVTGLGTPIVSNLAADLLDAQKSAS
jgi:kumamolisin